MSESPTNQQDNVVPLKTQKQRSPKVTLARMPAAMHQLREKAHTKLQARLRALFDKADDALFELADQAGNNHEQNLYFDSMREVRLRRKETERDFFHQIDIAFARLLDPASFPAPDQGEPESGAEGLSLVGKDELEEMVASETMVNRANERYAEKVQHLTLRMDQLVPVKVYQKNNPIGPDVICEGFVTASDAVDVDVKARLVLFKLFDRLVMGELGDLYDSLNQHLVEANILPSLQLPRQSGRNTGGTRTRAPSDDATDSEAQQAPEPVESQSQDGDANADALWSKLRQLLGSQAAGAGDQPGSGEAPATGGTGPAGPSLSSQDLMKVLTLAQRHSDTGQQSLQSASAGDVREAIGQILQRGGAGERNLNQVDEDVINLVSMMFEFILDDRNLPSPMKALLARLQIPMIKVAIADKSFFGKGGHPARRLLNEMANAALGWQDPGEERRAKDGLYKKVDETVQRVIRDYNKDAAVFESLLVDFRAHQEKEKRRARILEQRTIDAEDGKAKSQRARAEVDAALDEITAGEDLPPAAAQLLATAWSNVLFITCLKEGPESEAFSEQMNTAQDLVWSATADMCGENRQKLLKLVPNLLKRLRQGLEDIAFNPYQMGQLFKALEKLHLERLRRDPGREQAAAAKATDPEPEKTEAEESTAAPAPPRTEAQEGLTGTVAASTDSANDAPAEPTVSEPTEPAPPPSEPVEEAIDPQHLALVSNLTQGSWFEINKDEGESFRCRLAAIIKPTGKYIFVNRTGMKVAEQTREELACALGDGRMRLLDDGMLFDRALESVIGNLRQSRQRG